MSQPIRIATAKSYEIPEAFSLMYQRTPASQRSSHVDRALKMVGEGDIRPSDILLIHSDEGISAMMMHVLNAGSGGQVWLPEVKQSTSRDELEDALLQFAVDSLLQRGANFVQAMIDVDDGDRAASLVRAGFVPVSTLLILAHSLQGIERAADSTNCPLHMEPLAQVDDRLFQDTLYRTYTDTLDFPELNGIRTVTEIMEAHRHQGTFHPEYWRLFFDDKQPVGVSLLVEHDDCDEWELSYIGIIPEARRCGFGRTLVLQSLDTAASLTPSRLTVSVDKRNKPAWDLYQSVGFKPLDEHLVFMYFRQ